MTPSKAVHPPPNRGNSNPWLSSEVRPLDLTAQQQADVAEFMKALTGEIDPEVGRPPVLPH